MNKTISVLAIAVCAAFLVHGQANPDSLLPDASAAAVDYFLKLEGVDGESKDSKHKDWIEVESFSFGVSTSGSGGGGGAGKAKFSEFSFVKLVDKASPALLVESASGKHFPQAEIVVVRDGTVAMTWKLKDVVISSYQIGAGEEIPVEMVSLNLASVEVSYGSTTTGWDIKTNKKIAGSTESTEKPATKSTTETKTETSTKTSTTPTAPSTQPATRAPADSDGDGITDDKDKCPTEAETKNSYQDDDGCADRAPTTTTVPKTITPIAPKLVTPLK